MGQVAPRRGSTPPTTPRFHQVRRYQHDPHVFMQELFTAHGNVVRWRGFFDVYLINDPDHVRKVLAQGYEWFSKRTIDYRVLRQLMGRGLVTNDGPHWMRQRRVMQPLFASSKVNSFDVVINDLTVELTAAWERRMNETIRVDREMSALTFRIVGRTLFGSDIDRYADEMAQILDVVNLQPQETRALMTLLPWLPTPHNLKWKRARKRLDEIVYAMIAERQSSRLDEDNILDRLIEASDDDSGERMSRTQMRDEIVTLMLAGHETSATALTWTLYLLATHPEVERRLYNMLRAELRGQPATAADLPRIPYLKQVVQESMRLCPPVWAVSRRCEQGETFGPYSLPADSYVGVITYSLHRNPAYWPDPERFDPERFTPERSAGRHSYCYLPFGAGPRTCIGAGMAMLEIQLVLARLVQHFEARVVPGHPVEAVAKVTLKPGRGLPMTIQSRRG